MVSVLQVALLANLNFESLRGVEGLQGYMVFPREQESSEWS